MISGVLGGLGCSTQSLPPLECLNSCPVHVIIMFPMILGFKQWYLEFFQKYFSHIYSGGQYYALLKTTDQSKSQQPYDHNHDGPYCVLEVWGCPHGLLILPLFIEFW
jgi:hypothetical protein